MKNTNIYVQVDKTVVRIGGLEIRGLNTVQLEEKLRELLNCEARVIGVTGNSLDFDLYGIEEEQVRRSADGIIDVIAMADGITATDIMQLARVEKIKSYQTDGIPEASPDGCRKERWL